MRGNPGWWGTGRLERTRPICVPALNFGIGLGLICLCVTEEQVRGTLAALNAEVPSIGSVFAGRIADTGVDPMQIMETYRDILAGLPEGGVILKIGPFT